MVAQAICAPVGPARVLPVARRRFGLDRTGLTPITKAIEILDTDWNNAYSCEQTGKKLHNCQPGLRAGMEKVSFYEQLEKHESLYFPPRMAFSSTAQIVRETER